MQKKVVIAKEGVWGRGGARALRSDLRLHLRLHLRSQVGVGGALAIVVAAELQPQFVAQLLQMLAFTTLSPLLSKGVQADSCATKTKGTISKASRKQRMV